VRLATEHRIEINVFFVHLLRGLFRKLRVHIFNNFPARAVAEVEYFGNFARIAEIPPEMAESPTLKFDGMKMSSNDSNPIHIPKSVSLELLCLCTFRVLCI